MKNIIFKSILIAMVFGLSAYAQNPKEDSAGEIYETLVTQSVIKITQAQQIALEKFPGEIIGIYIDSLSKDTNVPVYRVYVLKGAPRVIGAVTIDAKAGKILNTTILAPDVFPPFRLLTVKTKNPGSP